MTGSFAYAPASGIVLNAGGGQVLHVSFTPTDSANYESSSADVIVDVTKAATHPTWAPPAAIVYGTALGGAQLSATADVPGTFAYSPASGIVLNADSGQPLHVAFTPTDSANYESSSADVTVDVTKAALSATAASAAREFGAANPAFAGTLSGVVNGDAISAAFSSAATAASPEGTYPIVTSLSDPSGRLPNYVVSLVDGTLTVVDTHPPVLTLPPAVSATASTPAAA